MSEDLLVFATTLVIAVAAMPTLVRMAPRFGLLDRPDSRKLHARPVPTVGGTSFVLALLAAAAFEWAFLPARDLPKAWFALAVLLIYASGLFDDARDLKPWVKGLVQIGAALLLLVPLHLKVTSLGAVLFPHQPCRLGACALPYTVLCLVGFVNAFNMLDGVDGLAGGVGFVMFGFVAAAATLAGGSRVFFTAVASAGALAGFLAYNMRTPWRHHAKVFLGDQGSLVLGFVLGWAAIRIASAQVPHPVSPMAAAWILGLPVVDTLVVIARRLARRTSPFRPDRMHLHHVLLDLGLPPGAVMAVMMGLAAGYGAVGLSAVLFGVSDRALFAGGFAALVLHGAFIAVAQRAIERRAPEPGGKPAFASDD